MFCTIAHVTRATDAPNGPAALFDGLLRNPC